MNICSNILTILFLINFSRGEDIIYGTCTTPTNDEGLCKNLRDCQYLSQLFQNISSTDTENIKLLQDSQCGYLNDHPLVCCHEEMKEPPTAVENQSGNCGLLYPLWRGSDECITNNDTFGEVYPWSALILSRKCPAGNCPPKIMCGGSLINQRYVLTTASCVQRIGNSKTYVRLGEHNYDPVNPIKRFYFLESSVKHDDYSKSGKRNDVGLIRLNENVKFSRYISPICIPSVDDLTAGDELIATGWGLIDSTQENPLLFKTEKMFRTPSSCQLLYNRFTISDSHLCACGKSVEVCFGDSGGSLIKVVRKKRCAPGTFHLVGMVSRGTAECGTLVRPAIYTKVVPHHDWIHSHIEL